MNEFIAHHRIGISALVVLIVFGIGYTTIRKVKAPVSNKIMCTQDAKQCPDGSYVGRGGPSCQFAACPVTADKNQPTQSTTTVSTATTIIDTIIPILPKASATIKYNSYGFQPGTTTISQGQTIDFINTANRSFRPVADIRSSTPVQEFNAQTTIPPGSKYTFTFSNAGTFGYHNELQTFDTGVIIVQPAVATSTKSTIKK